MLSAGDCRFAPRHATKPKRKRKGGDNGCKKAASQPSLLARTFPWAGDNFDRYVHEIRAAPQQVPVLFRLLWFAGDYRNDHREMSWPDTPYVQIHNVGVWLIFDQSAHRTALCFVGFGVE